MQEDILVMAHVEPRHPSLRPVPICSVAVCDAFWRPRMESIRRRTLHHIYQQFQKTGTLTAYQWEWWDSARGAPPWRIWVGDLGKWIEAASYALAMKPDARLERLVDGVVKEILAGQKPDGYLYSNPLARDRRWANLQDQHELYDVGHLMEAAVALHEATGKRDLLDALCRHADLLLENFGWGTGKRRGYDGHPEIELALVRLARATDDEWYMNLAKFFVDVRGTEPNYFVQEAERLSQQGVPASAARTAERLAYYQAHRPVREQREAVGHAVRALYLYCGMADVAVETSDRALLSACRRLWKSIVRRRMYVTGGVGSTADGEAFTFDYDLPNETAYAETCAAIALVLFAHRMLQVERDAEYADVMERALYNGVLSGLSLDGTGFFYANRLTVFPAVLHGAPPHLAANRQPWFPCACCPPNIARTVAGLGRFIYSQSEDELFVHLYVQGTAKVKLAGGSVDVSVSTEYPWDEKVRLDVRPVTPGRFTLGLRLPGWCRRPRMAVNGQAIACETIASKGYARITRTWSSGDRIEMVLPMPVERFEAHPHVRMNCAKVALQRGPIVYCLEEVDNGPDLADLRVSDSDSLKASYCSDLLGGTVVVQGKATRRENSCWRDQLYRPLSSRRRRVSFKAVPYALWGNRQPSEMMVWLHSE